MSRKICIFTNDSLLSYYNKGEIKERYFNPNNYFDEVHIISLFDEEIGEDSVNIVAGTGILKIHKMGRANLSNYKSFEEPLIELIREIKPDIIRSYNPLIQGWLATRIAKKLGIPIVISLHTNYLQQKEFAKKEKNYLQYMKLIYTYKKFESFVIKNSDAVICVYEFIVPYAKKMDAKNIHVIYNRVDVNRFSPNCKKELNFNKPTIISVGRLTEQKNHRYLIEAIKDLDANLLIIGDGPNFQHLNDVIQTLQVEDKVQIIKRVPNEKLCGYYTSCDVYAQPMEFLDGIPMPVLEAMACGLPVVMSKHQSNYTEVIDEAIVFVDNNPKSFADAIKKILSDQKYKGDLERNSKNVMQKISGNIMEQKERELYENLIR